MMCNEEIEAEPNVERPAQAPGVLGDYHQDGLGFEHIKPLTTPS